jgi:hypothetical protein
MTPSDQTALRAHEILHTIRAKIDESRIAELIDEPIEAAARQFQCPDAPAKSQTELLDQAAAFLRHLHVTAFPAGRQLTQTSARAEAVRLLESAFPNGFRGALLEVTRPDGPGLPGMLAELCTLLINRLRISYLRWVVASQLERTDWPTRCQMASILLAARRDVQPNDLPADSAEQWADFLPLLLEDDRLLRSHSLASALA